MRVVGKTVFISVLSILSMSSMGMANQERIEFSFIEDTLQCVRPSKGGGDVPSPFTAINEHVELANGEYYALFGKVVAGPGPQSGAGKNSTLQDATPYLEIDLQQHPWLASAARKKNPYYPLEGGWAFWSHYAEKRVQVTVQARMSIYGYSSDNYVRYSISLRLTDPSAVVVAPATFWGRPNN